jgi:hypothetical protein
MWCVEDLCRLTNPRRKSVRLETGILHQVCLRQGRGERSHNVKKSGSGEHAFYGWKYINKLEEVKDGVNCISSFDFLMGRSTDQLRRGSRKFCSTYQSKSLIACNCAIMRYAKRNPAHTARETTEVSYLQDHLLEDLLVIPQTNDSSQLRRPTAPTKILVFLKCYPNDSWGHITHSLRSSANQTLEVKKSKQSYQILAAYSNL